MRRLGDIDEMTKVHILDGDGDDEGGGHAFGTGVAGKTEFPETWSDDKITHMIADVAKSPDDCPLPEAGNTWRCRGIRDEVSIVAILSQDGSVRTGYPKSGPGVFCNPRKEP